MGDVQVPADALYSAQTQRAVNNFKLDTRTMPAEFLRSLALVKAAAARANRDVGNLPRPIADAIHQAALDIAGGAHEDQFPVPVLQTGSGTSTNMNMNEVLARLASLSTHRDVHPNDHVNAGQSSNDVIPTAIHVSTAHALAMALLPALDALMTTLARRCDELHDVVKTGRTHLMDAMPITFGQELGGWRHQLAECRDRFNDLMPRLLELPIGGSAVGTGVNVPEGFPEALVEELVQLTGQSFRVCANPFSRMAGQDVALECSSTLRALAVVLTKINNDLRWMGSGPLSGLSDIQLAALQPGSSIMPGKVNPVLPEATLMAAAEMQGIDTTVSIAAQSGNFQLNVMLPIIADRLLTGIALMRGACRATAKTLADFTVNEDRIRDTLASNPILVTALNKEIGYDAAAAIAKRSYQEKRPVLEVALEETDLSREQLETLLDPLGLTGIAPGKT